MTTLPNGDNTLPFPLTYGSCSDTIGSDYVRIGINCELDAEIRVQYTFFLLIIDDFGSDYLPSVFSFQLCCGVDVLLLMCEYTTKLTRSHVLWRNHSHGKSVSGDQSELDRLCRVFLD